MTADKAFASARVRQMTTATQFFLFVLITQGYQAFAYTTVPGGGQITWATGLHVLLIFSPFIVARVTPLMAVLPGVLLRDGAQIQLHDGGVVYTFDAVKRPLFLTWDNVTSLSKTRFGLCLVIRPRDDLFEGMPKYQAEFWRARTRKPIYLPFVQRFQPQRGLWLALAAARRAGVRVDGFADPTPQLARQTAATRHQGPAPKTTGLLDP